MKTFKFIWTVMFTCTFMIFNLLYLSACKQQQKKTNVDEVKTESTTSNNLLVQTNLSDSLEKQSQSSLDTDKEKTVNTTIDVSKTKSIISINDDYDAHHQGTVLSSTQKTDLKLDNIQKKHLKDSPNGKFYKGKIYYQGLAGRIESVIVVVPDHATWEFLISYDANGNYKDSVMIGCIMDYAGDRQESVIEGNKIKSHYTYSDMDEEDENEEKFEYYEITPDLKFIKSNTK